MIGRNPGELKPTTKHSALVLVLTDEAPVSDALPAGASRDAWCHGPETQLRISDIMAEALT
jgi:hypothetical protein